MLSEYIKNKNANGEKILSIFITSGFPSKKNFVQLAKDFFTAGADILEIGIPFSDPLADGPTIQQSSLNALKIGINIDITFSFVEQIRHQYSQPIILMGYANPILNYGIEKFAAKAVKCGVNGMIVPDIPLDEHSDFFNEGFKELDIILLAAPNTSLERLILIDQLSEGFIYFVSITGTTGKKNDNINQTIKKLSEMNKLIRKNSILTGFGISTEADVKLISPYCNGVIVGSAIIKSLQQNPNNYENTLELIARLKNALY